MSSRRVLPARPVWPDKVVMQTSAYVNEKHPVSTSAKRGVVTQAFLTSLGKPVNLEMPTGGLTSAAFAKGIIVEPYTNMIIPTVNRIGDDTDDVIVQHKATKAERRNRRRMARDVEDPDMPRAAEAARAEYVAPVVGLARVRGHGRGGSKRAKGPPHRSSEDETFWEIVDLLEVDDFTQDDIEKHINSLTGEKRQLFKERLEYWYNHLKAKIIEDGFLQLTPSRKSVCLADVVMHTILRGWAIYSNMCADLVHLASIVDFGGYLATMAYIAEDIRPHA